jgi:hypothetical protein
MSQALYDYPLKQSLLYYKPVHMNSYGNLSSRVVRCNLDSLISDQPL